MQSARETWFLLISVPLYIVVIGAELLMSHWGDKKFYTLKGVLQNVYLTLMNGGLDLLLRWLFYVSVLQFCFANRFIEISNPWIYWPLLFLLEDFAFYIEHRVDHYSRIFWAVHLTHHSSEEFNLTTGFRSSVLQPVYRFFYFIPIALLGFDPLDIVFMYSITQTYGILVHTQFIRKMPRWFSYIFVTPSHHRVHHASNIRYLDKNMGMCLIIWDRMFGTFAEETEDEPVKYGLTKSLPKSEVAINHVMHEWRGIGNDMRRKVPFSVKLKYLFKPPGWSHDGSTKTADQMRKEQEQLQSSHS